MHAYKETYLNDARDHLGEMFDYAINTYHMDRDKFWSVFASSRLADCLSYGDPRYVAGMSGYELFANLIYEVFREKIEIEDVYNMDRSKEYWAGWALAYFQWRSNYSFNHLYNRGITLGEVIDMYILHEAPEEKFVEIMNDRIRDQQEYSMLKRLRTYAGLTQKELSKESGVSLRMVQLYEQRQNDLSKAQAEVVLSLAQVLNCDARRLI